MGWGSNKDIQQPETGRDMQQLLQQQSLRTPTPETLHPPSSVTRPEPQNSKMKLADPVLKGLEEILKQFAQVSQVEKRRYTKEEKDKLKEVSMERALLQQKQMKLQEIRQIEEKAILEAQEQEAKWKEQIRIQEEAERLNPERESLEIEAKNIKIEEAQRAEQEQKRQQEELLRQEQAAEEAVQAKEEELRLIRERNEALEAEERKRQSPEPPKIEFLKEEPDESTLPDTLNPDTVREQRLKREAEIEEESLKRAAAIRAEEESKMAAKRNETQNMEEQAQSILSKYS